MKMIIQNGLSCSRVCHAYNDAGNYYRVIFYMSSRSVAKCYEAPKSPGFYMYATRFVLWDTCETVANELLFPYMWERSEREDLVILASGCYQTVESNFVYSDEP